MIRQIVPVLNSCTKDPIFLVRYIGSLVVLKKMLSEVPLVLGIMEQFIKEDESMIEFQLSPRMNLALVCSDNL